MADLRYGGPSLWRAIFRYGGPSLWRTFAMAGRYRYSAGLYVRLIRPLVTVVLRVK